MGVAFCDVENNASSLSSFFLYFHTNLHTKTLNPSETQHETHLCAEHCFKNSTKYNVVDYMGWRSLQDFLCLSPTEEVEEKEEEVVTPYLFFCLKQQLFSLTEIFADSL